MLFQKWSRIFLWSLSILGGESSRMFRLRRKSWREIYLREVDEYNPSCCFQNGRKLKALLKKAASDDAIRTWLWSELGTDCQTPLTVDVVDNEESLGLTLRITSISSTWVAACSSFGDANECIADDDSIYSRCTLTSSKLFREI
jgi:hypothetical protein